MTRRDFSDVTSFYDALEELVVEAASASGVSGMLIPGGRTPMALYKRLLGRGIDVSSDFRFILSDERYCAVDSADSNQGAIRPLLLQAGADERQFLAPDVSLPLDECVKCFDDDLDFFLGNGGTIRTALLGVGADGHTAGIFDDVPRDGGIHACTVARPDGMTGITCTPELCRLADSIVFILRGAEKVVIVERLISEPESTVAGRLVIGHPKAEIWFCLE